MERKDISWKRDKSTDPAIFKKSVIPGVPLKSDEGVGRTKMYLNIFFFTPCLLAGVFFSYLFVINRGSDSSPIFIYLGIFFYFAAFCYCAGLRFAIGRLQKGTMAVKFHVDSTLSFIDASAGYPVEHVVGHANSRTQRGELDVIECFVWNGYYVKGMGLQTEAMVYHKGKWVKLVFADYIHPDLVEHMNSELKKAKFVFQIIGCPPTAEYVDPPIATLYPPNYHNPLAGSAPKPSAPPTAGAGAPAAAAAAAPGFCVYCGVRAPAASAAQFCGKCGKQLDRA